MCPVHTAPQQRDTICFTKMHLNDYIKCICHIELVWYRIFSHGSALFLFSISLFLFSFLSFHPPRFPPFACLFGSTSHPSPPPHHASHTPLSIPHLSHLTHPICVSVLAATVSLSPSTLCFSPHFPLLTTRFAETGHNHEHCMRPGGTPKSNHLYPQSSPLPLSPVVPLFKTHIHFFYSSLFSSFSKERKRFNPHIFNTYA